MERYRKTVLDNAKSLAKRILKPSRVGRWIYPVVQKAYRSYAIPMKRRRLQRHGVEALRRMHELLMAHGVPYYCDAGTLLGLVRDRRFMPHDDDMDIAIMEGAIAPVALLKIFIDNGYGYVHAFDYNGRILMFTVADPSGITLDVFFQTLRKDSTTVLDAWGLYWFADRQYPKETANTVISYPYLKPTALKTIEIFGVQTVIPENVREVLTSEFGPWETPDPNFIHESTDHTEWPGFGYRLTLEEALSHT